MPSRGQRTCALALLTAADAAFLWMFLSTGPLEQIAALPGTREPTVAATRFAAEWRHGMAGNSWIYMPGFFATAAALWLHARVASSRRVSAERVAAGLAGFAAAFGGALPSSPAVVRHFSELSGIAFTGAVPSPSAACAFAGVYTLLTWSVFVLACRSALRRRTLRPFVPAAILAGGLAVIRPWTVDDFTGHWARGVVTGDIAAGLSLALVVVLAGLLAVSERRSAKPQPGEPLLPDGGPSRAEDEEHVGGYGDRVKAR